MTHRCFPIIRPATLDDLPAIIALLADDTIGQNREDPSDPPNPVYTSAFQAIAENPNDTIAVIEDDTAVVGCLQLTFLPGLSRRGMWRAQIEGVRVASSARGRGFGHLLLQWAIDQARAKGCSLVQLTADKRRSDAHRFYADLGFEASHEGMKLTL
ncbi:MAG: GNAT family N-acetyltransferase [Pseudomonadota bacterium]